MHTDTAIWWIRRDLRLADNPALLAAAQHQRLIALYIHATGDDAEQDEAYAAPGAAARWWLHHSTHWIALYAPSAPALFLSMVVPKKRSPW